jgi:hypothetical protein
VRAALAGLLARGGPAWEAVAAGLADADLPATLAWLGRGERASGRADGGTDRPARRRPPDGDDDRLVRRLKERARVLQAERDEARRRAEGAEARAEALGEELSGAAAEIARAGARIQELEAALRDEADRRAQAVERERRRGDSRVAEFEQELRDVRRRDETRRQERARRERAREIAEESARQEQAEARRSRERARPKVEPGRPTTLPASVVAGTREESLALLAPGRRVLVDGYNVTLTHRKTLTLEEQRVWLVSLLAGLAARRRARPTVVFDGRGGGGGGRPSDTARGVAVVFTPEGVTADDEITLAVQATDEPLVVVTDDRGLRDRVRPYGVDLLHTQQLLWVAG